MDLSAADERAGRGCVLVVDDDRHIASFIVEVLEDEGYDAETASDGAALAALDRRERDRTSLILLDYNMPVCDGPAFAAAYRERPVPHAPVVCLTAAHSAATRCAERGAESFLGKPFGLHDLLALVERSAASVRIPDAYAAADRWVARALFVTPLGVQSGPTQRGRERRDAPDSVLGVALLRTGGTTASTPCPEKRD